MEQFLVITLELPSFFEIVSGILFEEAATPKGECIEIGEWKTVLEKIMVELKKEPTLMEKLTFCLKSLKKPHLDDNYSTFLSCLLTHSTVQNILREYAAKCKQQIKMGTAGKKNSATASIRLQGNSLFVKKEYRAAFKMYTRALMFAKDDDEETPLLYANRSATYFHLEQFENALEDIERAFQFGYDKIKPVGKLLIRKGFSLLALGRDEQVKELLDANMPANENDHDFAQWQQLKKQSENVNRQITKRNVTMSQFQDVSTISTALSTGEGIFCPHERYPWLNAKIDLRYDAGKGYSLVSKEEMKYGEIVALSKPFVNLDPKRDSYERCHYCMVPCFESPKYFSGNEAKLSPDSLRMATPLACPECCNVLYCSEACRTAAWTAYHRFECSQMPVLAKIDSKAHLALRRLYMIGSLEVNSPNEQLIRFKTIADPCALMIDQQAYPFVYTNRLSMGSTLEEGLELTLTTFFLLNLVQISGLLNEPKNIGDQEYLMQAGKAYTFLTIHLYQDYMNETMPFTDPSMNRSVTPSPFLSVDGMTAIMKHSCEATVASSTILTESFESTMKLLYATGGIPAGTELTLAYDLEELPGLEQPTIRKYQLWQRYKLECACTRCVREEQDTLDSSTDVYYPIACSVCGSLMVRSLGKENSALLDGSYRCSSTDSCNFKYSARQMKAVYERVGKMMEIKENINLAMDQLYSALQTKVYQMKAAIESTASLLYRPSVLLTHLYAYMASCYLLITLVPTSNRYSGSIGPGITSSTHTLHRGHLTTALLYLNKVFDILEAQKQGPSIKPQFPRLLAYLFNWLNRTGSFCLRHNEQLLFEMLPSLEQVRRRYDTLLKMTAYDTMVASSLRHQ